MKWIRWVLVCSLWLISVQAAEIPSSGISAERDVPSRIRNCVNVINGEYFFNEAAVCATGPTPLAVPFAYDSFRAANQLSYFGEGFYALRKTRAWIQHSPGRHYYDGYVTEDSGVIFHYSRSYNKDWSSFPRDSSFSNWISEEISAQTNLRNQKLFCDVKDKATYATLKRPDGSERYYHFKSWNGKDHHYTAYTQLIALLLDHEKFSNGNTVFYKYDGWNFAAIEAFNSLGEKLNWLKFSCPARGIVRIETSDAQIADYVLHKEEPSMLLEIHLSDGPTTRFDYDYDTKRSSKGPLVQRRSLPDGRYQAVEYTCDKDMCVRVSKILEPVGIDDKPIAVATFKYFRKPKEPFSPGRTEVRDAQGNLTIYHYPSYRIDKVEYCAKQSDGSQLLQATHRFHYNDDMLIARSVEDAQGVVLTRTAYQYDARGNIVEETLQGNLTGSGTNENFSIKRFYDQSDFNLLLSEDDGRKRVEYKYVSNTALLGAKEVYVGKELKKRESYTYDKNGVLTSKRIEDLKGEQRITRYKPRTVCPALGAPEEVEELCLENGVEKLLRREVIAYSSKGKPIQRDIYDASNTLRYTLHMNYDEKGRLILETDALGQETRHAYDANGNRIFTQGPSDDFHTEFRYDFSNRLIQKEKVEKEGKRWIEQHRYDTLSHKIADIDIYGNETKYIYDAFGNLLETHLPAVSNAPAAILKKSYDALGRVITSADANGYTTTYRYNTRGQPIEVVAPNGSVERSFYTLDGLLERVVHCDGRETRYQYDYDGREIAIETFSADGQQIGSIKKEYSAFHLMRITETNGRTTQHAYDAAGRLSATIRGDHITRYTYDDLGRLWKTNEDGRITIQEYDLLGRVVEKRIEDVSGKRFLLEQYRYDACGNCIETIHYPDDQPASSHSSYNAHNEVIKSIDAEGRITRFIYERDKVLKKTVVDSLGNTVTTIYNARGQPSQMITKDALDKKLSERFLYYDGNGNCCETRDWTEEGQEICKRRRYGINNRLEELTEACDTPEAKRTTWQYDSYQRLVSIHKPNGVSLTYSYDPCGRISRICASDASVHDQYSYDEMHRLVQVRDKDGCLLKRAYDLWDRCIEETLSNGVVLQRTYDALGRCKSLTLPDQTSIHYEYDIAALIAVIRKNALDQERYRHCYLQRDLAGRLKKSMLANQAEQSFSYDRCGRYTAIETDAWRSQITYDAAGRLQERTIYDAEGILQETFAYDGKGQLLEEQGAAQHRYVYDSLGNCKSVDDSSCQHNALNQLLQDAQGQYSYDANGNLISFDQPKRPLTCRYDAYDRLIEIVCPTRFKAEYRYDAFHRRVVKQMWHWDEDAWQIGPTWNFIYDGQNEIGAIDANGEITELRLLGVGFGAEIGAAVAIELDSIPSVPIHDSHGNMVTLLDLGNDIIASTRYSAFGEATADILSPWGYASKRFDVETHWVYFGRRYYSPSLRRWITSDPKGEADGPNLYAYLLNDPYNRFDLYGEASRLLRDMQRRHRSPTAPRLNPIQALGKIISGVGRHCMPAAILQMPFIAVGDTLQGQDPDYPDTSIRSGLLAGDGNSLKKILYNKGLNTADASVYARASEAHSATGADVYGVWRGTGGFMRELFHGISSKLGLDKKMRDTEVQMIKSLVDSLPAERNLDIIAHSNGGSVVSHALDKLYQDYGGSYNNRVNAYTFGSATIIKRSQARKVTNYISRHDAIPLIAAPFDLIGAALTKPQHVIFLHGNGVPFVDHNWDGQSYESVLQQTYDLIRSN